MGPFRTRVPWRGDAGLGEREHSLKGFKRNNAAFTPSEETAAVISADAPHVTTSQLGSFPIALFLLLLLVIASSPWYWGGNRPLALLSLELLAVAIVWLTLAFDSGERGSSLVRKTAWALLALPGAYLIPLPLDSFSVLPGRDIYGDVLHALNSSTEWRSLSVYAFATESAWLALLPPIAVFLGLLKLPTHYLRMLTVALVVTAVAQAMLGLIQYGDGPQSWFRFGNLNYTHSAVGTFANRNHLANMLAVSLPLATAFLVAAWWRRRVSTGGRHTIGGGAHAVHLAWWTFALLLLLLGLLFTGSRAGILVGLFGLVISLLLLARRVGRDGLLGWVGGVSVAAAALATVIGLGPILARFSSVDPLTDVRWTVFGSVVQAIGEFFPIGSGPGTFADVYPRFQPLALNYFVNHAHNDYLEWTVELGFLAVLAILWILSLYLYRWLKLWQTRDGNETMLLQMGAGVAALVMALHSALDFNFHIPANAIYFAACLALFFHSGPVNRQLPPQRRSYGPRAEEPKPPIASSAAGSVPNPFLSD